jgi:hypothetical protein
MRTSMILPQSGFILLLTCAILPAAGFAADVHSIETQLRRTFPSLSLQSSATFETADAVVSGRFVSGLRARFHQEAESSSAPVALPSPQLAGASPGAVRTAEQTLEMQYPRSYGDAFVVESGSQRLVLRAVGASVAPATQTAGKVLYEEPYPFTDAIEVPRPARSEELLLLRDRRAPRIYDYEIVASEGIAGVILDDGAVRFLPKVETIPAPTAATGRFSQAFGSLQIDRPWVIDASGLRSESAAQWMLLGGEGIPTTVRLILSGDHLQYPLVVDPSFSATGNLATQRSSQTATLLPNGKVLIAGGYNTDSRYLASAELYDPATGVFSPTGSLATARDSHTETLLPSGQVLIAGGYNDFFASIFSAELYDPAAGSFSATGRLTLARSDHTATLLPNGKVLIAGGVKFLTGYLTAAELYDPAARTFTTTGSLATGRANHTATLLPNGNVLIAGGENDSGFLDSAELYDPVGGTFSATGSLVRRRTENTATLLPNGKVLIVGGFLGSAELYDPASRTFSSTGSLATARDNHSATLLPNGNALIVGGYSVFSGESLASAELYDPIAETFSLTGSLATARGSHTATLLTNGKAFVAGGFNQSSLASAELYDSGPPSTTPRRRAVRK